MKRKSSSKQKKAKGRRGIAADGLISISRIELKRSIEEKI
jgi:hypothetical protein